MTHPRCQYTDNKAETYADDIAIHIWESDDTHNKKNKNIRNHYFNKWVSRFVYISRWSIMVFFLRVHIVFGVKYGELNIKYFQYHGE